MEIYACPQITRQLAEYALTAKVEGLHCMVILSREGVQTTYNFPPTEGARGVIDQQLFRELLTNARRYLEQTPCQTARQAQYLEETVASQIAEAYLKIKEKQHDPAVQSLNNLLKV